MPSPKMVSRLMTCSVISLLYWVSLGALAHTGVRDQVTSSATSATTSNNAFTVPHGCDGVEGGADPLPVIAQSAVFPFGNASQAVWVNPATNAPIDPVSVIGGDGHLNLNVTGVQDESLFNVESEEVNPNPGDPLGPHDSIPVHALNWKAGSLNPQMLGYTQFQVSVPPIVDNCVSKLRIRIAVSNWCEKKQNQATDRNNNRADWWFTGETGTQKFTDPDLIQPTFWTTLTVNNPNVTQCTGTPFEAAVMPSGSDIDRYLPYSGFTLNPPPL